MHGQPQRGATRRMPSNKRLEKHQLDLLRLLHIQGDADSAFSQICCAVLNIIIIMFKGEQ